MRWWQTARTCKNRPSYGPSHSPRHSSRQKYAWSKVPIQLPWRAAWMQIEFQHGPRRRTSTWDEQGSKKHRDWIICHTGQHAHDMQDVSDMELMTYSMCLWHAGCVNDVSMTDRTIVPEIDWNLTCKWNLNDVSMTGQDLYMKWTQNWLVNDKSEWCVNDRQDL